MYGTVRLLRLVLRPHGLRTSLSRLSVGRTSSRWPVSLTRVWSMSEHA
jgi:hypothetical protein